MKKLLSLIFCIVLIFAFSACGEVKETDNEISTAPITTVNKFEIIDESETVWLTNSDIVEVTRCFDPFSGYSITINTTEAGKQKLNDATTANINKNMKILLNDEVIFSGAIMEPITEGAFIISGFESEEELAKTFDLLTQIN